MGREKGGPGRLAVILLAVLLAGAAAAAVSWFQHANDHAPALNVTGFDFAAAPQAEAVASAPSEPKSAPASGLGFINAEPGLRTSGPAAAAPLSAAPGAALNDAARRRGAPVSAFTARFRRQHPVMLQYSREWMRHPDLKKLNDDYLRDRDVSRFIKALAGAPSFGPLVKKIAADPKSRALAMDFVRGVTKEIPSDLLSSATAVLNDDKTVKALVTNVAAAFGIPSSLLPAVGGGEIDQKKIMEQITAQGLRAPGAVERPR